jgi:hypothetical protein
MIFFVGFFVAGEHEPQFVDKHVVPVDVNAQNGVVEFAVFLNGV